MQPSHSDPWLTVYGGDNRVILPTLPAESVHCVVTSPPFWGLRDYGHADQLGLEPTPEQYVENMVTVFREVKRVLRNDGTLWLNLGDSYAAGGPAGGPGKQHTNVGSINVPTRNAPPGLKPKDLVGIPWRVAFALQADGWYLRSDIIWSKPNPMPESVTDRPTKSHEYVFMLSKQARYYFDADAVREDGAGRETFGNTGWKQGANNDRNDGGRQDMSVRGFRNIRSVWTIPTQPYPGAHFAVFPPKLVEPCIKAGTSEKGVCPECGAPWRRLVERVGYGPAKAGRGQFASARASLGAPQKLGNGESLREVALLGWQPSCAHDAAPIPATCLDPFAGSGTVGMVAQNLSRRAVLVDLNPEYIKQQLKRNRDVPLGLSA